MFLCSRSVGQDAVAQPGQPLLTANEAQALLAGPSPGATGPEVTLNGRAVAETPRRFQYGLSITLRGVYDDNINISSFNRVSDYYFAIEPSLFIGLGGDDPETVNSLRLIYRPSVFLFVDHSENDTVQHLIRLTARHQFGRLLLSLSQDVQILDGVDLNSISDPTGHTANIDLGQRARHNIFTTAVSDSYELTGKLFLSNVFSLSIDDYPSGVGVGSRNFYGNLFLNYNYSPKLVIGIGGTGGYNTVDNSGGVQNSSPDQTYEQANVRVSYNPTGKLSLSASGGVEFRQFENNSRGTYVSPVYELAANYQPFDGTSITLSGSRRTQNSASLGGQDYAYTTIDLTINQRFMQRFYVSLVTGYVNSNYFSTVQGVSATRNDNYYYVEPAIDCILTRFWTAGAYYLYRENFSSLDFFSFYDNQFGVRTKLNF
jgi:opacity protein-like surface antigen